MTEVKDNYDEFRSTNTEVCAISVDTPRQLSAFKKDAGLPFFLLSDSSREIITRYHLLNRHEHNGIAYPAIFVVKPSRQIGYRSLDRTGSRVNLTEVLSYLNILKERPDWIARSENKRSAIVPSPKVTFQTLRNLFFRGDTDDWKHYLLIPVTALSLVLKKIKGGNNLK